MLVDNKASEAVILSPAVLQLRGYERFQLLHI